ncbi:peptide chain release factor N(5)-glutamine methyltransferase [Roseisalinus antarcticus]|uniref:Release factor glutamine methyltransferase n=1 Tax=Roseisalinus antarcticus TaxID=254357 RepID=A0A1Y5RJT1_9RHOB|nr:peptide chain release factor N(5)-glutamine methyltransferase [Roseisalinus antarcticus]SLN18228.1 Release factor glutamine methyltransferase [Roseisalinus antarcticus]
MRPAREALAEATRALAEAGIPEAGTDARRLLAHAMNVPPGRLTLMLSEPLPDATDAAYETLVARRAAREPVSHLTGRRLFYGREFIVTADVLDPRPETETLIEVALAEPFDHVLDLGTGSGCILFTLLAEMADMGRDSTWGIGVEASDPAFEVAWWNRNAFGLEETAVLLKGSWFAPLAETVAPDFAGFDLIVSNPPYIREADWRGLAPEVRDHEPKLALTAGRDGLDAYREILGAVRGHMAPGGRVAVETGVGQGPDVMAMMLEAGLDEVHMVQDLDGRDRVVIGRRAGGAGRARG